MKRFYMYVLCVALIALFAIPTLAKPSTDLIKAFVAASESARKPDAKKKDLERFLAFLSDDLIDNHVAYARSFKGKDHLRKGIPRKAAAMVSITESIESIVLGTRTAVVVVNEDSKYYKDKKLKHFKGRTILVLEFDKNGLISKITRYLD